MRTLLLTGHSGFVGRTLRGVAAGIGPDWHIATLPDAFDIRSSDLADQLRRIGPDAVIHLAGLTSVAEAWRDPEGFFDVNFNGTWNLLRSLRAGNFRGRLVFASSGDCYGKVDERDLPIGERAPLHPRNPYAVSKAAAEALCYQWSQAEKFEIVIARAFNHIGPGQDRRFAVASFARQVARIRQGRQAPRIVTGDLDITRDLTDARDVTAAYFALVSRGRNGEVYNVGTGRETRLRSVVELLISIAGVEVEIEVDRARLRQGEQRRAAADVTKIERETGWRAEIPLETTLRDLIDDWSTRAEDD